MTSAKPSVPTSYTELPHNSGQAAGPSFLAPYQAVVMGDIVGSEAISDRARLYKLFNEAVDTANSRFRTLLLSPLTITLGDEFQGLAPDLMSAFAVVCRLRLALLQENVGCRFVIGRVVLETPINTDSKTKRFGFN